MGTAQLLLRTQRRSLDAFNLGVSFVLDRDLYSESIPIHDEIPHSAEDDLVFLSITSLFLSFF
jgi:hypothetical protein